MKESTGLFVSYILKKIYGKDRSCKYDTRKFLKTKKHEENHSQKNPVQ